jgi:pilus assembly protein CpaE
MVMVALIQPFSARKFFIVVPRRLKASSVNGFEKYTRTDYEGLLALSALILGPDGKSTRYIYERLISLPDLRVYQEHGYPGMHDLVRMLNTYVPDLVFLELGGGDTAVRLALDIAAVAPATAVIGVGGQGGPSDQPTGSPVGFTAALTVPCNDHQFRQCVETALVKAQAVAKQNLIAFLPAKAGSGATTAAVHVSGVLARDYKKTVLLIDADLHSGLLSALLRIEPEQSIVDAVSMSYLLNDALWKTLVTRAQGFDVLPTPLARVHAHITPWEYHRLIAFATPRYDFIIVDLPEVINDATEAIARRAKRVNVVCTPERASIILARRRIHELEVRMVSRDQVHIVLNRYSGDLSITETEHLLGCTIGNSIPNDYQGVIAAAARGSIVDSGSKLGKSYRYFAADLAGIEAGKAESRGLSLFQRFS